MARKKPFRPQSRKADPLAMYAALSSSRRFEEDEKVAVSCLFEWHSTQSQMGSIAMTMFAISIQPHVLV